MESFLKADGKEFNNIQPMMDKNEKLEHSGFHYAMNLSDTILQMHKVETNTTKMHNIFNTQFKSTIDTICESDKPQETIQTDKVVID